MQDSGFESHTDYKDLLAFLAAALGLENAMAAKPAFNGFREVVKFFTLKNFADKRPARFQSHFGNVQSCLAQLKRPDCIQHFIAAGCRRHVDGRG